MSQSSTWPLWMASQLDVADDPLRRGTLSVVINLLDGVVKNGKRI